MLHTVMRPSIESERIASPANSMKWSVPPEAVMRAMMWRMMSLASVPEGSVPSTVMRIARGLPCRMHWLASTISTSEVPTPKATAPQRAVRGGVAVAADDRHARLREPQFGADDVYDPLPRIAHAEVLDAVAGAVGAQRLDLMPRLRLGDGEVLVHGGNVVVDRGGDAVGMYHADAAPRESGEGHGRGYLVDVLPVDVEHRAAALLGAHRVRIPDFVQKRPSHATPPSLCVR